MEIFLFSRCYRFWFVRYVCTNLFHMRSYSLHCGMWCVFRIRCQMLCIWQIEKKRNFLAEVYRIWFCVILVGSCLASFQIEPRSGMGMMLALFSLHFGHCLILPSFSFQLGHDSTDILINGQYWPNSCSITYSMCEILARTWKTCLSLDIKFNQKS